MQAKQGDNSGATEAADANCTSSLYIYHLIKLRVLEQRNIMRVEATRLETFLAALERYFYRYLL